MDRNFERLTRGGQTFVLVPEKIYEDLQKDAEILADVQAYDAAKSRNEIFPAELGVKLSEASQAGKSLVPAWREYRELTKTALAEASGVNRVYLSEIELRTCPPPNIRWQALGRMVEEKSGGALVGKGLDHREERNV